MAKHLEVVTQAAEALRSHEEAVEAARARLTVRIYEAADAGHSRAAIARAAGVSRQWISALLERR